MGFGSASGGMAFGEVGQASGLHEVTLTAATVCRSLHRSGPNPRTGGEAGLEGSLVSPEEEP